MSSGNGRGRRSRRERLAGVAPDAPPPPVAPAPPAVPAQTPAAHPPPQLVVLGADRLAALRARVLALLEARGVDCDHAAARERLRAAGAAVEGERVRLPAAMVEAALAALPRRVVLCGKSPGLDVELPCPDGTFVMRTGTGAHAYLDPDTGRRPLVLGDVETIATVADGLDQVGFVAHPFVNDVPAALADVRAFAALVARAAKHCWIQPHSAASIPHLVRIAAAAAGGEAELRRRPLASCIVCAFSPLEVKAMDVEALIACGRHGLPVHACSLPSAGGTAPATPGGAALVATAEVVALATFAHVLAPGTPVVGTPLVFTLDPRTGRSLQSSPEAMQGAALAVETCRRAFGLVTHTYGAGSDSPVPDGQSQAERALLALRIALAGADVLGGVGQLECATAFSPLQAVVDDELGAMVRGLLAAPPVDDDALAWSDLAPLARGGHFLATAHTRRECRRAHRPAAFARLGYDAWEAAGGRDLIERARDRLADLARPREPALPENRRDEITRAVADAERALGAG